MDAKRKNDQGYTQEMILHILFLLAGLGLLVLCSDKLVFSAVRIAGKLGVSQFIIGLTIVSLGTALPELATSLIAAAQGHSLIALGNVIGSNIANLGLILGLAGIAGGMKLHKNPLHQWESLGLFGATLVAFLLAYDGFISRSESLILVTMLVVYIVLLGSKGEEEHEEYNLEHHHKHVGVDVTYILIAGLGLWVGARFVVYGAVNIAEIFNVGEGLIGMTLVAVGTSLPELSVAIRAAKDNAAELALGDLIGASMMNILLVLGAASFIKGITVSPAMLWAMPACLFFAAMTFIFLKTSDQITRVEGSIMLVSYLLAVFFFML